MKKQAYKLLPILLSIMLVTGCKGVVHKSSSNNYDGSNDSIYSSEIPSPSSDPSEEGDLDKIIAQFVDGLNVNIPSVNEYKMLYQVYYYYSYSQYVISAAISDDGAIESAYNTKCGNEVTLVSLNDDTYYPVDEYGYMYGDNASSPNVTLSFYSEEGYFNFMLTRSSGAGKLDVSDIDTNWYVDYINFNGFILGEEFPETDINVSLETNDVSIPAPTASEFPYFFEPESDTEEGHYAATYYVILEGDQIETYLNTLKGAGYETKLVENKGETINWDTYEVEEYTYYTGTAYDSSYQLFISIQEDESGNTLIMFNNFNDVASKDKTSNTDWTNEEKELMNSTLHQVLPFMAFGEDYEIYDDSDEEWNLLVLEDTYYEDLSADYVALLKNAGFKEDKVTYNSPCYYFDNGLSYIEVFVDYDGGHYLEIYYEASKLEPAEEIRLNKIDVQIVKGASFQLTYTCEPEGSFAKVTWSSNKENIATVDQKGLVTINSNAASGEEVIICATSSTDLKAECTFVIKDDVVSDAWVDGATVVPGGPKVKLNLHTEPYGATITETIRFEITGTGLHVDQDGYIWADETAVPGSTCYVEVFYGDTDISSLSYITVAEATVTHTLNQSFFGLVDKNTTYGTHEKTTEDGAYYQAQCASQTGIQIRSKNNDSGIIAHFIGRSCASITFTFDENTYSERTVNIYGSNTDFCISDMFDGQATQVGSVTYTQGGEVTFTYTFTDDYSYIGFRSDNGAIYFTSIEVVWR